MTSAAKRRLFAPTLVDFFLGAIVLAEFGRKEAWQSLLVDGDTGWHIRTGEFILRTGSVPLRDLFSFSRPNEPWYAWEWLADVLFALLHRWRGLEAVAGAAVVVLCVSAACLFCWLLRREAGLLLAVGITLAAVSASTVHHLARPHVFSLLFLTLTLWAVDEDRRRPGWWLWLLVPLTALWTNLHAGFMSWLVIQGMLIGSYALERRWKSVRRYGILSGLCAAATLFNPYGWRLHEHIFRYIGSSWIADHVQEFQSPRIRSENMLVFAVLLMLGVALVSRAFARHEWFEGGLALLWGFAAMRSVRHVPLYVIAAAPLIATECAVIWADLARRRGPRSPIRLFWEFSRDMGRSRRIGPWSAVVLGLTLLAVVPAGALADFPETRFPVSAVARNLDLLRPGSRVLTSDQWADYLIYRLYPRQRVFFDGRSDFYGPEIMRDYQALIAVNAEWRPALERYRFDAALLPLNWPLGPVLEREPGWRVVYRDPEAVLLVRDGSGLKASAGSADCNPVSN
jgi:uncharacterized membrane protein YbaN (DUF454 family)